MKIELKAFQAQRTNELLRKFHAAVADWSTSEDHQAVALSAPTGSGKTVIATSFIEQVLFGNEDEPGDEDCTFLWLTDQPQLNEQTARKMDATSDLDDDRLVIIEESFTDDSLKPGKVYFLNTQKLGGNSNLVTKGDGRVTTIWEALSNTLTRDPGRFVLIIDEAHRGMKDAKADPEFATTIVQRFIKGSHEMPAVPLVVGISATIQRFHDLMGTTGRTERKVEVTVDEVRASGLVKDETLLRNPGANHHTDMTMLVQGIQEWKEFQRLWGQYAARQGLVLPDPILLVQLEDGTKTQLTKSPLSDILTTLVDEMQPTDSDWLAHSFQSGTNIGADEYGYPVRYIAPADIEADQEVRAVLFKSSLNTGWDCPRAEVMVSFRTAKDPTNVAQLVGRMVRARLAKQILRYDRLNTVSLYLPKYDTTAVESVISLLNGAGGTQTATGARKASETLWLERSTEPHMTEAFDLLATLPSMRPPARAKMRPIDRLFRLAGLLAETKIAATPVEDASKQLLGVLLDEYRKREGTAPFEQAVQDAAATTLVSRAHKYGQTKASSTVTTARVLLAPQNLHDRYAAADKALDSRGLANAYMKERLQQGALEERIKAEFYALSVDGSVMPTLLKKAESLTEEWFSTYRLRLLKLKDHDEERYDRYEELLASAGKPVVGQVTLSVGAVEWPKARKTQQSLPRHMYVQKEDGQFVQDMTSWEETVMTTELQDPRVVAWLRNPSRKPWSLCVVYASGTSYTPVYPDFVLFRKNDDGDLEPEIVDPHLLADPNVAPRAAGMALYAEEHKSAFRRIDLIVVDKAGGVETIKRLNLLDTTTRQQVAQVTNPTHLKHLFDNAPLYQPS